MKDFVAKLNELLMLDVDAVKAYSVAIERIDIPYVKEKLVEFRSDHQRHITDLKAIIIKLGGKPKEHVDAKGPIMQGVTALRSIMGNEQALKAMKSNEELTNKKYNEALNTPFPADALAIVRRNRDDEARHLAFINGVIEQRIWESAGGEQHP
jgi:uncharacterized protein (TIGR02284 family)